RRLRRSANAAREQYVLARALDHADAAIAVGPVAGLGRVAQVRELDTLARRDLENGFARARLDLPLVEQELDRCVLSVRLAHPVTIVAKAVPNRHENT